MNDWDDDVYQIVHNNDDCSGYYLITLFDADSVCDDGSAYDDCGVGDGICY